MGGVGWVLVVVVGAALCQMASVGAGEGGSDIAGHIRERPGCPK